MKNRTTWLHTSLLFLSTVVAVFFTGISSANSEAATPFANIEFVEEPDATLDEVEALSDELAIEFDKFMVEAFKQLSDLYASTGEQRSAMRPDKKYNAMSDAPNFMDRCASVFDANDQLVSVDCDQGKMQTPVVFWFSHPSYKNILVTLGRYKPLGDFRDPENSFGTRVFISDREDLLTRSGIDLKVRSPGQRKELIPVKGALLVSLNDANTVCHIKSYEPFIIGWSASMCVFNLRESIAVLKRLNTQP